MTLLSICIPTYNHAVYLEQALLRLLSLPVVRDGVVEVVVSDNASSDGTQIVAERFASQYPRTVRYFRNAENVRDANFALALSRGTGEFRKLANDTLLFTEDGLSLILSTVRRHQSDRPTLFFANLGRDKGETECRTFDEFFESVSFHSTWIGSFGVWKEELAYLSDFDRMAKLQLTQVDALCRLMEKGHCVVVENSKFCEIIPRDVIGGYNLAQVFGHNYLTILNAYVRSGEMSKRQFRRERFRMLRYHLLPFYLSFSSHHAFPKSGYIRYLLRWYWPSPFYWLTVPFVLIVACACKGR